jgi:hypothetical protein
VDRDRLAVVVDLLETQCALGLALEREGLLKRFHSRFTSFSLLHPRRSGGREAVTPVTLSKGG